MGAAALSSELLFAAAVMLQNIIGCSMGACVAKENVWLQIGALVVCVYTRTSSFAAQRRLAGHCLTLKCTK